MVNELLPKAAKVVLMLCFNTSMAVSIPTRDIIPKPIINMVIIVLNS
jgi:hypothetical protein